MSETRDIENLPIFVINLERQPERLEKMNRLLKHFDLKFTRHDAIDGRRCSSEIRDEFPLQKHPHKLGCWASHLTLWRKIIDENIHLALILEDDCLFVPDFREKLHTVLNSPELNISTHIMYIGYSLARPDISRPLYITNRSVPQSTHAYIITLAGARFLSQNLPRHSAIDGTLGNYFSRHLLNGFRTSYLLAYQDNNPRIDRYPLPPDIYPNGFDELVSGKNSSEFVIEE